MNAQSKPFGESRRRVRQILLGWSISLFLVLMIAVSGFISDSLPDEWLSGVGVFQVLFVLATVIILAIQRFRGESKFIGGDSPTPSHPPRPAQTRNPERLMSNMIVPVFGYSLPLAIFAGVGSITTGGSVSGFVFVTLIVFVMTLPVAAFAGLTIFEKSQPGRFGPEGFRQPTTDDPNT